MAHHKSAIKRIRTNELRRKRNVAYRSRMRTEVKKFRQLLDEGDAEKAQAAFPELVSRLQKTASKGVIKKTTVSRHVSRLAKALQKLS